MKNNILGICLFSISLFACKTEIEQNTPESNVWELEIVDSIQVDYLGRIWSADFKNGYGYLKDISTNSLVKFDTLGKIISQKTYPEQGPFAVYFFSSTAISENDELYASTYREVIHHFDKDLNLLKNYEMPFISESRGGRRNAKNIGFWKDKILLWYPGRDGISPYIEHFYRDYPLLELFDPASQTSDSLIRLAPTSKFNSDLFFDTPSIQFSISGDYLYLALGNDPQVHRYSLAEEGKWLESIPFKPSEFHVIEGQKKPVGYVSGNTMYEATIESLYSMEDTLVVYYNGGISEEIFQQYDLKKPENYPMYPDFRKQFLKIYHPESGLSNEIILPPSIDFILNIESLNKPFYALRHDEYLGEEQDYLIFYKLQLKRK
ncbi:hypothetical protein GYM62_13440 [Algoriphagus sp. NBT04N3]|jgi:hypothetical protein|uniref:hypothetical protein n=1 Tax=Algoriphagus sp. NBT04N3 TaxID=2705473 RepID=UPI001C62ABC4|nr:hypothetical protein [Algoriphagus sp. NBT04N3]QYH39737.1 hypothetical protein GYM62_13440 [Algoriphagus sp. NBT04N3]